MGPKRYEQEVSKYDAKGKERKELTYLQDTKEENIKAKEELEELVKHYIFVVYNVARQDINLKWKDTKVLPAYQQRPTEIEWTSQERQPKWTPSIQERFLPHHFAITHSSYMRHICPWYDNITQEIPLPVKALMNLNDQKG